jgi:hypothetical protein
MTKARSILDGVEDKHKPSQVLGFKMTLCLLDGPMNENVHLGRQALASNRDGFGWHVCPLAGLFI